MRSHLARSLPACALWAALSAAGCGNQIGDACRSNVDCSVNEIRACDIAQPGGYCTIEGCDERSCPSEALCVRVFPEQFASQACDPAQEGLTRDDCGADQLCLPGGRCVPRATERRYCAAKCDSAGDCRDGYECRTVGQRGSVALIPSQHGRARFCAPRP